MHCYKNVNKYSSTYNEQYREEKMYFKYFNLKTAQTRVFTKN
jgi:hypothetical protein